MNPKKLGLVVLACACACGGTEPYDITIYGEEFIEESIPASDVADGCAIDFDSFLIAISSVRVGETDAPGKWVFDLTESSGGSGHPVITIEADRDIETVGYAIVPVDTAATGNVDDSAVDTVVSANAGLVISGTATRDDVTKTFTWALDTSTTYAPCEVDPRQRSAELTIHSDHLFYDDLESPEPDLRFDLFAQADDDGDANGVVTAEELEAVDITTQTNYQVGSREIDDLWGFLLEQSRTLGHIDGEGHCETN